MTTRVEQDAPIWKRGLGWLEQQARLGVRSLRGHFVRRGVPAHRFGWRHVEAPPLRSSATGYRSIHAPARAENPLPLNFTSRDDLPNLVHWWGYSMYDVPDRLSDETFVATFQDATITAYRDALGEFYPGILSREGHAINLREIKFRPGHGEALRAAKAAGVTPVRRDRVVWVLERVHENHSHWLTAHLPKLLLVKQLGLLQHVLLPERLKPAQEASLRMLGIAPETLARHDESRPLLVSELTLIGTDRFRPELLRPVWEAMAPPLPLAERTRRLYISRARARFRSLLNEDEIWPMLEERGFERIFMEDLSFEEQVELMRRTSCLVAPHGAGLTNMMFCAPDTTIVEIASLGFPNPNFYALAAAMGHAYYLVPADEHGDVEPLKKNMTVPPERLRDVMRMIDASTGAL
ncbi:MAG: glycosyltransferase family 61 protein [Cereibacter changlensis]